MKQKYTQEQIDGLAEKLRAMPPVERKKQEHSKQEAVRLLRKEIEAMQKRGYTLDDISEALRGGGLDITTPTLKNYLARAKPAGSKASAPRKTDANQPAESGERKQADASRATFTPTPDSDEI